MSHEQITFFKRERRVRVGCKCEIAKKFIFHAFLQVSQGLLSIIVGVEASFYRSLIECSSLCFFKVGDPDRCTHVSDTLQKAHNIYIQAINYPTVPRGSEKLRIAPTPQHSKELVGELVESLDDVWTKAGLPKVHPLCTTDCKCQDRCISVPHGFNSRMVTVEG